MDGRLLSTIVGGVLWFVSTNAAHAGPPYEWQQISPAAAGFSPDIGQKLDDAVRRGEFINLHAVVVVRDGKLVLERYYEGVDERRGSRTLGTVKFSPEVKHDLRSVTKSIVSLLYGVALPDGMVVDLDEPLVDQFPAYKDLAADPKRRRMTVFHALSMTMGTEWNENLPYTDPRNSETAMDRAADRYRYVLERPFVAQPGTRWNYNGGATALLAHFVGQGTERPLLDYAREKLFEPMGISDVEWIADSGGEAIAASGLRMRPRDLAKIGQLIIDRGMWDDSQLVPAEWLVQSFTPRIRARENIEYGYHWWLGRSKIEGRPWISWIGALGNGGQRLFVIPNSRLVVVINAGNYNKPDQRKLPAAVMREIVMPALHIK